MLLKTATNNLIRWVGHMLGMFFIVLWLAVVAAWIDAQAHQHVIDWTSPGGMIIHIRDQPYEVTLTTIQNFPRHDPLLWQRRGLTEPWSGVPITGIDTDVTEKLPGIEHWKTTGWLSASGTQHLTHGRLPAVSATAMVSRIS